ncbi:chitinase-3-like protein 1 isoform X2 [Littorina saxatilis]|uniref:Chitinase n=1 Tax=Littorina saxatilis TaxID=31220 RepID=A0AAN9BU20_9CAEN
MRTWVPLSLAFLLAAIGCQVLAQNKLVMCYYTNWSQYRSGRKFFPEQIDPTHCTHLVYSFAKLVGNRLTTYEWNEILDYTDGLYKRFNALKSQKPGLKTLLAVGGFSARSEGFSAMSSTASNRQEFVSTSITWLRDNDFDGLDIDWEYPGHVAQGGKPEDKANFVLLCQDLRNGFEAEARASGRDTLLLTAAVGAGYSTVSDGYDIPELDKYLDYINIMSYDLHGAWDPMTGHNAGLYTSSTDASKFSVADTAENWVRGGATRAKTLVGLATYGRTWTLSDPTDTRVGAPAKGPGTRGQYSGEAGYVTYYEVCEVAFNGGYTLDFDQESKVPFAHKGDQWITYDDINSLQYKMTWMRNQGFGGAIVWAIELDDFDGNSCGAGKYPLMRAISSCLINGQNCAPTDGGVVTAPTTTTTTTTTTTRTPITVQPTLPPTVPTTDNDDCPFAPGVFGDRFNCNQYWVCLGSSNALKWRFTCPQGRLYDKVRDVCDFSFNVDCSDVISVG